jgi:hypothetical protein
MLKIIQRFDKQGSSHLRVEYDGAPSNLIFHLLPALYKLPRTPNHHIFFLKMATTMFAESGNFKHSKRLMSESRVLALKLSTLAHSMLENKCILKIF